MGFSTSGYGMGERRGLSREMLILLGVGVVAICGVVVIVAVLLLGGGQSADTAAAQVSYDIPTSREAYVPAVGAVREVDLSAELASAAGAWTPVINRAQLSTGRTGWTFHFYLPTTNEMARVVVDRGGGARVVEVVPWETPPALLEDQGWQVDSSIAAATFLQTCQSTLNSQPDSRVEARLSMAAANKRLVWQIQVIATPTGQALCEVKLDATTGQPLP